MPLTTEMRQELVEFFSPTDTKQLKESNTKIAVALERGEVTDEDLIEFFVEIGNALDKLVSGKKRSLVVVEVHNHGIWLEEVTSRDLITEDNFDRVLHMYETGRELDWEKDSITLAEIECSSDLDDWERTQEDMTWEH